MKIAASCSQLHTARGDGIAVFTQNILSNIKADCYSHPMNTLPKFSMLASWYAWTYTGLSIGLNINRPDILINFDAALPLYRPSIHILYDIVPLIVEKSMTAINTKAFEVLTNDAVNRASKIVTISNSSKEEIEKHYGLERGSVRVIYPGYNKDIFNPTYNKNVLDKYGVDKKYALFIGTLSLKKNIVRIVEAFHMADVKDMELLLVGQTYALGGEDVEKLNRVNIRRLGYLPIEDLVVLLSNATMFIWPSLHEGFGLPVLEAMACGCPVITSNRSSLPEVVNGAGVLVNPYNVSEIANAIKMVSENELLRLSMIAKGFKRAKEFSWKKAANELLTVCEEVVSNSK
jgi:glycosyltransferase involved in cell wall biosynthesis